MAGIRAALRLRPAGIHRSRRRRGRAFQRVICGEAPAGGDPAHRSLPPRGATHIPNSRRFPPSPTCSPASPSPPSSSSAASTSSRTRPTSVRSSPLPECSSRTLPPCMACRWRSTPLQSFDGILVLVAGANAPVDLSYLSSLSPVQTVTRPYREFPECSCLFYNHSFHDLDSHLCTLSRPYSPSLSPTDPIALL